MKKRFVSSIIVALSLCFVVGCNSTKPTTNEPAKAPVVETKAPDVAKPPETTKVPEPAKPATIKMINRVNPEVKLTDNSLLNEIEKVSGFKLEIEAPPISNYNERLQVIMASGDYPDLVYNWGWDPSQKKWAKDGIFIELDDLVPNYPNLMKNITTEMWEWSRSAETGKIYAVPKTNKVNRWGFLSNKTWLDKLGAKPFTNIDEFYEFGKKVANDDPDGNGQKDTFLLSPVTNIWSEGDVTSAFLVSAAYGVPDYDGTYTIRERRAGYYPALTFFRKLYEEKIMDQEFFVNKTYDDVSKFEQGRIFYRRAHDTVLIGAKEEKALTEWTFIPPLKNDKGNSTNTVSPPVWGGWAITDNAKDVDAVLRFLDWGNSPEGFYLMNLGIEGVHYTSYDIDNRVVTRTEEQKQLANTEFSSYTSAAFAIDNGKPAVLADSMEKIDVYNAYMKGYYAQTKDLLVPYVKMAASEKFNADNPDLATKKNEMENKYVIGEITLEQLKAWIDKEYLPKMSGIEAEYEQWLKDKKLK